MLPLVAVTVKAFVPAGVAAVVVMVSVDVFAFASVIFTVGGVKLDVVSAEIALRLNDTDPVNPPEGVTVRSYVVDPPGAMVRELGTADTANVAAGDASEIFAMNTSFTPAFAD